MENLIIYSIDVKQFFFFLFLFFDGKVGKWIIVNVGSGFRCFYCYVSKLKPNWPNTINL